MKRLLLLFLVAIAFVSLALSGCGGGKPDVGQPAQTAKEPSVADLLGKGKQLTGLSYDYVLTAKEGQMTGQMWIDGKKIRSETVLQNRKIISIIDGDANVAYTYMPEQGMAIKMALDKAKTAEPPNRYISDVDTAKVKVLETTMYDGARCRVLLVQRADGKGETKLWLREDYGIPAKVETVDSSGSKTVMEYKNIKVGQVPAEKFQLPAGVKVTDMSGMMQQVPPKP